MRNEWTENDFAARRELDAAKRHRTRGDTQHERIRRKQPKALGDDAVELGPGEAVFVPQNAYHGFENNSDAEVMMAWYYAGAASLADAGRPALQDSSLSRMMVAPVRKRSGLPVTV